MQTATLRNQRARAAARAARSAWRRGMAALRDGAPANALRWLDRACRLAPEEPTLRLSLATAWLGQDAAKAARLFAELTASQDTREAWLGLAAARARLGDEDGAAAARARAADAGAGRGGGNIPAPSPSRPARDPPRRIPPLRDADIVVPVYGDASATLACLDSVLAARGRGGRVIVIDDASSEAALVAALDRLAARRRIVLIRHARNLGFPAAANAGLALARAAGRDALLLNSDTLVGRHFLARLRAAAYAAADIGTACPLSNNATILSVPDPAGGNPMLDRAETVRMAALAWAANGAATAEIPTAVGFCMYLRHDCLRAVGALRADVFGRGYGEENDFCERASAAGWRHVVAAGVFVAHAGEASFGAQAAGLRAANAAVLARLHPGYAARVAAHVAADPLFAARRALDIARWRVSRPARRAVLLITHAEGGGVARSVAARCAALRAAGEYPIVLAPAEAGVVRIEGWVNLRFTLPAEHALLLGLLRAAGVARVEFHHTMDQKPEILALPRDLRRPHDVYVHDYHWLCPRLVLSGAQGRYCGEPDLAGCEACIRKRGGLLGEEIGVADLRARSARLLGRAGAVIVPSEDAAARLRRYFPGLRPGVAPPGGPAPVAPVPPRPGARRRVIVVGAIGAEKGFHVLLAMARDAAATDKNLEFVVVGHSLRDAALLRTGRVFITGPYAPAEAVDLIRAQAGDLALLPSVVPETWCHALSEIWAAGLYAMAFDLGAQAERIRSHGQGGLLPLGLPAGAINNALLAARW